MENINFMQENAVNLGTETFVVSRNIENGEIDEIVFELKKLSYIEVEQLVIASLSSGNSTSYSKCEYRVVAKSVVVPNLNNVELQNKYNVSSDEMLLRAMLNEDEYLALYKKIREMYIK